MTSEICVAASGSYAHRPAADVTTYDVTLHNDALLRQRELGENLNMPPCQWRRSRGGAGACVPCPRNFLSVGQFLVFFIFP